MDGGDGQLYCVRRVGTVQYLGTYSHPLSQLLTTTSLPAVPLELLLLLER
eukprot:COSAG06_NODE_5_length_38423_cov_121.612645_23_plen_50_part_00